MLAGITRHRLIVAHSRPNSGNLVGRNRRSDASSVYHDAGIRLATCDAFRHPRGRVGIVDRIGRQRAEVVDGQAFPRNAATIADLSASPLWSLPIATRRMSATGASPSSIDRAVLGHHGHAACLQRIGGQRRHVPTFAQLDRLAYVEQAGICLGNDLEPFHVIFRATVTTLFTAEHIQKRIVEMAGQMNADYPDGEPLHFVAVLKGAFVFLSDLARAMSPRPVTLDFIAVSSYGAATKSSVKYACSKTSTRRSRAATSLSSKTSSTQDSRCIICRISCEPANRNRCEPHAC